MPDNIVNVTFDNDLLTDGSGNSAYVTGSIYFDYTTNQYNGRFNFASSASPPAFSGFSVLSGTIAQNNGVYSSATSTVAPNPNFDFSYQGQQPVAALSLSFVLPDGSGDTYSTNGESQQPLTSVPVCFTTGTLIRVARGGSEVDVPVEALVVGDAAVTASGLHRPIRWIGHRVVDCRALRVPSDSWPVRVRAGAFGVGACGGTLPERDLRLSPGHPVLVGTGAAEVLVPIMCLINGTSIARVPVDTVTYWHVELDAHDILLAEGLPAESFLDYGNRSWFADDGALTDPDVVAPGLGARCRPVAVDGPAVEAERRRLDALFATSLASACAWPGMDDGLMGMSPRP